MANQLKFANNVSTTLASPAAAESTTLIVNPLLTNIVWPSLTAAGDYFTIVAVNTGTNTYEIMHCTAVAADGVTLTVTRGAEGTTPLNLAAGSLIENRLTAESLTYLVTLGLASAGISQLPVSAGGTGASTAPEARTNLGVPSVGDLSAVAAIANAAQTDADTINALLATTPAANKVPQADANGKLSVGWLPSTFIAGGMVMFSGTFGGSDGKRPVPQGATAADEGWTLCDGTNGTPDLRGKFIIGAGGDYAAGATGGAASAEISGTTGATTLTVTQMPIHKHSGQLLTGTSHNVNTGSTYPPYRAGYTGETGGSGSHTHSMSATVSTLPPYYALCYIMKLAG